MCDPITAVSAAGAGVSLLGSVTGVIGQFRQAGAEMQAAQQKAAQDQQNQQLAEAQAGDALRRGAALAARIRMQGDQVQAQERVGYAASGVDSGVGTAARVQASTAAVSELDAQTAKNNAAREAWGFKVHAQQYGQQAGLDLEAGSQARTGSILGGLGMAAGVAGQAAGELGGQYDAYWKRRARGAGL